MITMLTHHWLERPEDYPCFSISLNVDNELDKPEILSFLSLSPSKVLSEE
jgi:hypothetical protein